MDQSDVFFLACGANEDGGLTATTVAGISHHIAFLRKLGL